MLITTKEEGEKKPRSCCPIKTADIGNLIDTYSQADPKFKSTFTYTKVSAKRVREALILEKGYREEQLPCRQTIGDILNRMGYRLKKPEHVKALHKIPETDAMHPEFSFS